MGFFLYLCTRNGYKRFAITPRDITKFAKQL